MAWQRKNKKKKPVSASRAMLYRQIMIGIILTILLSGFVYGVWYVTRLPAFTITTVEVSGGETIAPATVEEIMRGELQGTYYRLIPKQFTYFYPYEAIVDKVAALDRVKEVSLDRADRHTLTLTFTEYVPHALWCEAADSALCFFINDTGYAFAAAPSLTGGAFTRYVEPTAPTVGTSVYTAEYVAGTSAFSDVLFSELALRVTAITRDEDDVFYTLAGGGELRTSLRLSYEETLQNLQTILESEEFAHLEPGAFSYIDLRYGNKVFVHEGFEEVATSTEEVAEESES